MSGRFDLRIREHLRLPEKKRLFNERHFAAAAPRYDLATRAMSFGRDAAWKRRLVAELPPWPSPLCVDLACGTGDVAFLLAERYPRGQIIGLDLAGPMLEIARRRCRRPNVRFSRQDLCRTGLAGGRADIVTGSYALRNAPDLPQALGEVRRLLRPGGVAAFLDFARPSNRLLAALQCRLLRGWCGLWGLLLHGNPEIHGYIGPSLAAFPDRRRLGGLAAEQGLEAVCRRGFFLGMLELLVLRRVEDPAARLKAVISS